VDDKYLGIRGSNQNTIYMGIKMNLVETVTMKELFFNGFNIIAQICSK